MPLARTLSVAVVGVEGHLVEVEADLAQGLPGLTLIGLPDTSLQEARDRVRAAVVNSGEEWPQRRTTIALSPAMLPKRGSGFDVAMAVALLTAAGVVPPPAVEGLVLLGELGLDGRLRPVSGVLPAVAAAVAAGRRRVVVPAANGPEAALVPGAEALAAASLTGLLRHLRGEPAVEATSERVAQWARERAGAGLVSRRRSRPLAGAPRPGALAAVPDVVEDGSVDPADLALDRLTDARGPAVLRVLPGEPGPLVRRRDEPDLADVIAQDEARGAVEVAAAGGHHLFLLGPPGAGKTMLAERLPGLLPPLDAQAALEVSTVHSVAGLLRPEEPMVRRAPFRDPHHTATLPALIGGGSGAVRPGEASLAHRGVLFLDEAPEFPRTALDALRQPLESGSIAVARAKGSVRFPARFLLVLAANPCPCGEKEAACRCTSPVRRRYLARLSGPLLDRVDLRVDLVAPTRVELVRGPSGESTAVVAARVAAARERTRERLRGTPWLTNAEVPGRELRGRWRPGPGGIEHVEKLVRDGALTLRGVDRVLRVAWTLADLEGADRPTEEHVHSAATYRSQEVAAA